LATQAPAARPRPGGGRLFIIVGLLLAVLAGAGVFFLGGVLGNGGGGGGGSLTVVIAKQAINPRHKITTDDLTTATGSGSFLTLNAYQHVTDVVTLIAEVKIQQGAIITSDMLARDQSLVTSTGNPSFLPLAAGYVAMTVPTSEQQGVAGHITVDDYITIIASTNVSIFASGTGPAGPPKVVSKTVFRQVRVIGVGPAINNVQPASGAASNANQQPTSGVSSSLTIELTQCDAEFMTWFLNNTQLRYTLEAPDDYLKNAPSVPDTKCPSIDSAQGVSNTTVNNVYHFTSA
jgi:Flp pilus assembly protein CpaB